MMGAVTSFDELLKKYPKLSNIDGMRHLKIEVCYRMNTYYRMLEGKFLEYNPVRKTIYIHEDGVEVNVGNLTEKTLNEFSKNNYSIYYDTFKRIKNIEELRMLDLISTFRTNNFNKLKEEGYILDFVDYRLCEVNRVEYVDVYDKAEKMLLEYYMSGKNARSLGAENGC